MMTFAWPQMLWALLAVPLLAAGYLAWSRRRAALRDRLGGLRLDAGPGRGRWRHLPPALLLGAIALLLVSVGRPAAVVTLPAQHETVILALDVSGSMRATDVQPTRLAAAQSAAKAFVKSQPRSTRIGIVTFAGVASLVQPPTEDREEIAQAIDRLQPQRGTAIGSAIVVSLATIFPGTGIDLRSVGQREGGRAEGTREQRRDAARGGSRTMPDPNLPKPPDPVPAGSYDAAVIVLMSDGQSTTGPDPVAAAKLAADRGVRVYTVGVGTTKGEVLRTDGWSMRVALDESQLKTVADLTRGEYFHADSATELERIYRSMGSRFVMEKKELEVGALFAGAAALLVLAAAGLSVAWYGRVL
ncbi:MAG TPA: VWA domain-containing protein [Burkholderiaceae bacterium]|nr:VWA domain-containing protein [Burkholderiaceae bacterium]